MAERTIRISEVDYTAEAVEKLREEMIVLRDEALKQGDMSWSVILSHVVAYMAVSKEIIFHA